MQSLNAFLWNSCYEKKKLKYILENVRDGVSFDRVMCGNVLLKIFGRKNSYSENSQVLGNAAWDFKVFTNKVFTNQCGWIYILLHNWSVAGGWKIENMIVFTHWWKVVHSLVCRGGLRLYSWYYYIFKFRFKQILVFCLNQMIWFIGREDEN